MKRWFKKHRVRRFTERFSVTQLTAKYVRVNRLFGYVVDDVKWTAHQGLKSDYSTIPNIFAWFVAPYRVRACGLLHDEAFKTGVDGEGNKITYWQANTMWRLVGQFGDTDSSMRWYQAWLCWLILTLVSWPVWLKYRRKDQAGAWRND